MGNHSFSIVAYSGAWLTTIGGVWFLFEKVDETLAPDVRARLGDWLDNLSPRGSVRRWPSLFIALFDQTFGERHLSWFCLRRSVIASFLVTWIVGVLWMVLHPPDSLTLVPYALVLVTLGGVLFTIIPDFLSLLETRLVLKHLSGGGSAVVWLLVDAIATGILGGIVVLLYVVVNQGVVAAPKALWQLATFRDDDLVGNTLIEHGNTPPTTAASAYAMPLARTSSRPS